MTEEEKTQEEAKPAASAGGGIDIQPESQWGDPVRIGTVSGQAITVRPPLNELAIQETSQMGFVALALAGRLQVLEGFVQVIAQERMARLQAEKAAAEASPAETEGAGGDGETVPEQAPAEA